MGSVGFGVGECVVVGLYDGRCVSVGLVVGGTVLHIENRARAEDNGKHECSQVYHNSEHWHFVLSRVFGRSPTRRRSRLVSPSIASRSKVANCKGKGAVRANWLIEPHKVSWVAYSGQVDTRLQSGNGPCTWNSRRPGQCRKTSDLSFVSPHGNEVREEEQYQQNCKRWARSHPLRPSSDTSAVAAARWGTPSVSVSGLSRFRDSS